MATNYDAVFQDGTFRLVRPLAVSLSEGQHVRLVQNRQFGRDQFDFTGRHLVIFRPGQAGIHAARDHDNILIPQLVTALGGSGIFLWAVNNLSDAFPIPQIHKNYTVVVAHTVHPAGKGHGLTNVSRAEFITMMGAIHGQIREKMRTRRLPWIQGAASGGFFSSSLVFGERWIIFSSLCAADLWKTRCHRNRWVGNPASHPRRRR